MKQEPFRLSKRVKNGLKHYAIPGYPLPFCRQAYCMLNFKEESLQTTHDLAKGYWEMIAKELTVGTYKLT